MKDAPHQIGKEDLHEIQAEGADALAMMILQSLSAGELPPPDMFKWYTKYAVLRFIEAEFAYVYAETPTDDQIKDFGMLRAAVFELRAIVDKNGQFGLATEISDLLRRRQMHLPTDYITMNVKDDL